MTKTFLFKIPTKYFNNFWNAGGLEDGSPTTILLDLTFRLSSFERFKIILRTNNSYPLKIKVRRPSSEIYQSWKIVSRTGKNIMTPCAPRDIWMVNFNIYFANRRCFYLFRGDGTFPIFFECAPHFKIKKLNLRVRLLNKCTPPIKLHISMAVAYKFAQTFHSVFYHRYPEFVNTLSVRFRNKIDSTQKNMSCETSCCFFVLYLCVDTRNNTAYQRVSFIFYSPWS